MFKYFVLDLIMAVANFGVAGCALANLLTGAAVTPNAVSMSVSFGCGMMMLMMAHLAGR